MPEASTVRRARKDKREGKAATTQAGEFVREEIHHIRRRKHGARSTKQAIAIGLSKARRAGVKLPAPKRGTVSEKTRKSAERAYRAGQSRSGPARNGHAKSPRRSRATVRTLKREGHKAASRTSLSRQARSAAKSKTRTQRSTAAKKAARTRARRKSS